MDAWRQWIRHRTASVNETSTRYSIAIDSAQTTQADAWRTQAANNRQGSGGFLDAQAGRELSAGEAELQDAFAQEGGEAGGVGGGLGAQGGGGLLDEGAQFPHGEAHGAALGDDVARVERRGLVGGDEEEGGKGEEGAERAALRGHCDVQFGWGLMDAGKVALSGRWRKAVDKEGAVVLARHRPFLMV